MMGWLAIATISPAETINFYSPPNQTNLTSTGVAMDANFVFELGVFADGFVPSPGNIPQWNSKWASLGSATYSQASKSFDGQLVLDSNSGPFSSGTQAWVLGKRVTATGDELILMRHTGWNIPLIDPMLPGGFLVWNAATANQVVIGSINGSGHLMKSEAVVTHSQWQSATLAGEPLNTPAADPDQDGVSNLLEFIFGTNPQLANAAPQTPVEKVNIGGNDYLQIQIPRLRGRLASLTVQVSSDLITWNSGPSHTVEVSSTVDSWVVRDLTPVGGTQPRRFFQLKAELP
jgi:hypothetical protein